MASSWRYGTTSASYSVRISTAVIPKLPHTSRIFSAEDPGEAVIPSTSRPGISLYAAATSHRFRDHHRGDDRLAHARRQDDQSGALQARLRDVHLVGPFLHRAPAEELVGHIHMRGTTRGSDNLFHRMGGPDGRPTRW